MTARLRAFTGTTKPINKYCLQLTAWIHAASICPPVKELECVV